MQPRTRQCVQYARPKSDDLGRYFGQGVERSERRVTVSQSGQRADHGTDGWLVTPQDIGQTDDCFRMVFLRHPRWIGIDIADPVVHRREACGVRVVKMARLERCWSAGTERQAV